MAIYTYDNIISLVALLVVVTQLFGRGNSESGQGCKIGELFRPETDPARILFGDEGFHAIFQNKIFPRPSPGTNHGTALERNLAKLIK